MPAVWCVWYADYRRSSRTHAAMLRHYGWTPKVEVGLVAEWDGCLGRVSVVCPDRHDWSKLARYVIAYAPGVTVWGSLWEDDAFGRDRANVEDATPAL